VALSLHPILFLSEGPSFDRWTPGVDVIQYAVVGLPASQNALIGRKAGRWQILRVHNNVPDSWRGDYETAETALAVLADELKLEAEARCRARPSVGERGAAVRSTSSRE
jgi:hypothetical protein